MNTILSKLLCNFILVLIILGSNNANAGITDTTKLLADNIKLVPASVTKTIVKEANISYPANLKNNIGEAMDYVEKFSNKKRDYLIHTYQKGKKYFPKVTAVLKHYNLPQELKVLLALESGFNANAVSSAGAVGYWQMMDEVAREYGLHIIEAKDTAAIRLKKKDDRTNFSKSTLAAARYFSDRRKNFNNDILLMVASYNCGSGNVRSAMKKSGKNNPDFWDIKKYLAAETRNYVMNFIALNVVFENYDNFFKNKLIFTSEFTEVPVSVENPVNIKAAILD